jgi:glutathione S-transferase
VAVQPESHVILYQAEWCPFSSAVRELLTELSIDVVLRQVEPFPEGRTYLRELAGTDEIPVLQAEDGQLFRGTREIFAHLATREPGRFAEAHRRRYAEHREARESGATERLLGRFPPR